jgi:hypothetical protein
MDPHEKTALSLELYRIAAGQPCKGLPVLERVIGICRKFLEDDPRPRLRRELKALQLLMTEWTREEGWWSPADGREGLREKLNQRIDHILEIAVSAAPVGGRSRMTMPRLQLRSA